MSWKQKMDNALHKAKNRANNGKDYDVMNPEEENPNVSSANKQTGKALGKAAKAVGKAVAKIGKSIIQLLVGIGPVGWVILVILIILIIVSVIMAAWNMMPGMMRSKLSELFKIDISSWFTSGAVAALDDDGDDIIQVVNYLESMDYSLIGDGFVTPALRKNLSDTLTIEEILENHKNYRYTADDQGVYHFYDETGNLVDIKYYNSLGQTVDNLTGKIKSGDNYTDEFGIVRSLEDNGDADENARGKVVKINNIRNYRLIRSYLLSNYRIYTLKNADESLLKKIADAFRTLGGNNDAWAKGLIKLYNAEGGFATGHWWWGNTGIGSVATLSGNKLTLKGGAFNNETTFNIEGWAPRYGMSLDFLIALHLGTGAPELVNAMLQNFDTEMQVYLDDSGVGQLETRYLDPKRSSEDVTSDEGDTIEKVNAIIENAYGIPGSGIDAGSDPSWINSVLDHWICQVLLTSPELTLTSQDDCLQPSGKKCSEKTEEEMETDYNCCDNCRKYVVAAVKAMLTISKVKYQVSTPYIARVIGSWFRDTYFIIPKKIDAALKEYAGDVRKTEERSYEETDPITGETRTITEQSIYSTNHPEYNVENAFYNDDNKKAKFVEVDKAYLEESGEYWTKYEQKDDGSYQLYVLNGDGTTSDTTLENFLQYGFQYKGKILVSAGEFKSQAEAEDAGWAFVKKAITVDMERFSSEHTVESDRLDSRVYWSAYGFTSQGSASNYEKVKRADGNSDVNALYDIIYGSGSDGDDDSGIFYSKVTPNGMSQVEDAQRGETNALVKYLFKYRKFYIYDGGESRGVEIEHDKQRVLYGYENYYNSQYDIENKYYNEKKIIDENDIKDIPTDLGITVDNFYQYKGLIDKNKNGLLLKDYYGWNWKSDITDYLNRYGRSALRQSYSWTTSWFASFTDWVDPVDLAEQWLDWQLDMYYMDKFGIDLKAYYHTNEDLLKLEYDPRDPDLIGTIEITKSSLSIFSILENTGSLDAEYAYRDLKELVVELNYFDKEDMSSKIEEVFTWLIPEIPSAGWPIRPWDKLNTDYGTLLQSHNTYKALGALDDSSTSVDTSKLYFIGDSWTVALVNEAHVLTSDRTWAEGGKTAYNISGKENPPSDTSGFVIAFGKNSTTQSHAEAIEQLAERLLSEYPKLPVFILKLSYEGEGGENPSNVDNFNSILESYCASNSKIKFIDPTKTINDTANKKIKSEYAAGTEHLNSTGYKVWYKDIITEIGGENAGSATGTGSGSSTTTATGEYDPDNRVYPTPSSATGPNFPTYSLTDEECKHLAAVCLAEQGNDGIEFEASIMCNLYERKVVDKGNRLIGIANYVLHGVNNNGHSWWGPVQSGSYKKKLSKVTPEIMARVRKVICEGKRVIPAYVDTHGGYMRTQMGTNYGKTIYKRTECIQHVTRFGNAFFYCFPGGIEGGSGAYAYKNDDWNVQRKAQYGDWCYDLDGNPINGIGGESGVSQQVKPFEGYEADQKVVSPVTGRILEIGKHERLDVYTGEMVEVEFITIQVMETKNYFDNIIDDSQDPKEYYGYDAKTRYTLKQALSFFFEEYEDVCEKDIITLDGFDVDLSIKDEKTEAEGTYEQKNQTIYGLANSGELEIRQEKEKAKVDVPYFIKFGVTEEYPGDTYVADTQSMIGYYVKEGKYIGKTIAKKEEDDDDDDGSSSGTGTDGTGNGESSAFEELPDKLTYTYEDFAKLEGLPKPSEYIRIQIKDKDYALVDDVERFFDIPELEPAGGNQSETTQALGDVSAQVEALKTTLGIETAAIPAKVNQYMDIIKKYCGLYGLDPYLVRAMICQESGGNVNAEGSAIGLMQWEKSNGDPNITIKDASGNTIVVKSTIAKMKGNADEQIKVGCAELKARLDDNDGNVAVSLQGYNFGQAGVCTALGYHVKGEPITTKTQEIKDYIKSGDTGWLTDDSRQKASDYWKSRRGSSVFGDPKYVEHVLRYYKKDG